MPNLVKGEGPLDAKIVLIGEAPGATENVLKRPFMGASGNLKMIGGVTWGCRGIS